MSKDDRIWLSLILSKEIIKNKLTIREAAEKFNMPKSTIYDYIKRVEGINPIIYSMVQEVFQENLSKRF
jgi:predicted DNA-binding protein YlxM (UPF0122 family)